MDKKNEFEFWYILLIPISVYMLPTIIASNKIHINQLPIMILNILLGWTVIGWIVALV